MPLLTFAEARDELRISDHTLRSIIARGELRAGKIGAHWRFRRVDLDDYLDRLSQSGKRAGAEAIAPRHQTKQAQAGEPPSWERYLTESRRAPRK